MKLENTIIKVWQLSCMAMTLENTAIKVWQTECVAVNFFDKFPVQPRRYKTLSLQFDNFTVWLCTFLTKFLHGHDIMKYCHHSLTNLLCGCEHFWQIIHVAMALWDIVISVWQFYCVAVNSFDKFPVCPWHYEILLSQFDKFTVWLWTFLTVLLYGHEDLK